MSPENQSRVRKGVPAGGQYTAVSHAESAITLEPAQEPLTRQEIEWARKLTGTVDADCTPAYYPTMHRVFEAALSAADSTPQGRRAAVKKAEAEKLAETTGVPAREVLDFHNFMAGIEPGTKPWQEGILLYAQDIWNQPRGTVTHIDARMREATGEPARGELIDRRRELSARIGAIDVPSAARALKTRFPGAHGVVAHLTTEVVFSGNGPQAEEVWITRVDGSPMWKGTRADVPELSTLTLMPGVHEAEDSPLRTSRVPHYNGPAWHHYDLDKMAAVTAEELLEDRR